MSIRKTGTSGDQQVDTTDDPGAGQGVRKSAVRGQGMNGAELIDPRPSSQRGLPAEERDEIIRGEG